MHLLDTKPDIMCLSETWLTARFVPKFPDYCAVWDHREGWVGGGLGILVH